MCVSIYVFLYVCFYMCFSSFCLSLFPLTPLSLSFFLSYQLSLSLRFVRGVFRSIALGHRYSLDTCDMSRRSNQHRRGRLLCDEILHHLLALLGRRSRGLEPLEKLSCPIRHALGAGLSGRRRSRGSGLRYRVFRGCAD